MNKQKYIIEMIEEKFKNSTSLTVEEYKLIVRAWETLHNTHDRAVFVQAKREVEQEAKEEPAPEGMGKSAYALATNKLHESLTAEIEAKSKDQYGYIMQRLEGVSQTESYLRTRDLANEIREKFPSVKQPHTGISRFLHRFMGMGKLHKIQNGFYKGVKK